MRKIILPAAVLFLVLPFCVLADPPDLGTTDDVIDVIENIRNFLYAIFGICVTICFIIAGFYFITAGGDPDKIKTAKSMVKYGIIGTAMGVVAGGMAELIGAFLGA